MKVLIRALAMIWQCDRRSFLRRVAYVAVLSVLPLANLYVLKLLVDSVTGPSAGTEPMVELLAVYTALFLLTRLTGMLSKVNNDIMTQRLVDYMCERMQRQSARLDMAYFDNPAYHDTYHRAQQESSYRPLQVLGGFMGLFGSLLSVAGIVTILASVSWWIIAVMVAALVPSFVVQLRLTERIYAFRRSNTQEYRRTGYYAALLGAREYAQEVRTYGLSPLFRERFVKHRRGLVDQLLRISRRLAGYDALCSTVEAAALFGVVFFLIGSTATGSITVGSFVMLFEAFRRGNSQFAALVGSVSTLYDNRLFLGNLFEFLDLEPRIVSPKNPVPFPAKVERVEFRDITFRYPGMERDVLSHFSLTARAGEVTLVEGRNGFGKTTLLKLLLRLYDADEGAVLVNGTDVRLFDVQELRRGIGAVFQNFVRFQCTAYDNIAFGDVEPDTDLDFGQAFDPGLDHASDLERVKEAARRSGADEFLERLPQGYGTTLGRMFDDGQELSMGQWQRVALARQLYGNAQVMLFDEPMAWLDRESRERLDATIEALKKEGKVIILIRHV